jgi:Tripartite tricarboxylate transporter TctB family
MKIKSQRDFWSGLMFVAVGLGFAWGATNYSFGSSARPGPGYFPFGLGMLMAILGGAVLFKALSVETEDGEPIGKWAFRPLVIIMGSVIAFGWLLPRLGMAISLPILSVVVLTLGSWLIFIKGLSLVIPLWPKFITG